MIASWLALEDIHPTSGPLHFYPGSHRLGLWDYSHLGLEQRWLNDSRDFSRRDPQYERDYAEYQDALEAEIERRRLPRSLALLHRGEALLWAASLLHGGSEVLDRNRSRLSQATHYFLEPATGEPQTYWVPSISRYSRKQIRTKDSFGRAMPIARFSHVAPREATAKEDRGQERQTMASTAQHGRRYISTSGLNAFLPDGFRRVDQVRIDVARIWMTNRTRFWMMKPVFRAQCARPGPPDGNLVPCEHPASLHRGKIA